MSEEAFGGQCTTCGTGYVVNGTCMTCGARPPKPESELTEDERAELADTNRTLSVLSDRLTQTANALKGDPPELVMWSWHDLPEAAAKLRAFVAGVAEQGCEYNAFARDACLKIGDGLQCLSCRAYHALWRDAEA